MWNTSKKTNQETEAFAGIEAIEAIELDNVIGGCACGCNQADCNCANGNCANGNCANGSCGTTAANWGQQFIWA